MISPPEAPRTGRVLLSLALVAGTTATGVASRAMTIFDFSQADSAREWRSINDTVMGGVSSGRLAATGEGTAVFTGEVSLENNGGFASVRSLPNTRDLRNFQGLALRVRGDGRRYKVNLKTDASFDGVLYRAAFDTVAGEWQTLLIRFAEFVPTFRGRVVPGAEPLDLSRIASFGLMISDKQAGPFRLELASIQAIEH